MNARLLATTVVLISLCPSLWASIWNIPAQFATIQAGLNAAAIGDTILVQPGIYPENIVWPATEDLSLFSAGNPSNTTIDGSGTGRVLEFDASTISAFAARNAFLKGFTIQNGFATDAMDAYGAGIYARGFHLDFEDLEIRNNTVFGPRRAHGGGMYMYRTGRILNLKNVTFANNLAYNDGTVSVGSAAGAGLYADFFNQLNMDNVQFLDNACDGQISSQGSALYTTRCTGTWSNVLADGNDCRMVANSGSSGATVHVRDQANFDVQGLSITNNTATTNNNGSAAGLYVLTSTFTVDRLNVSCNTANFGSFADAAGIYLDGAASGRANFTATNALITNNTLNRNSTAFPGATGVYLDDRADATFINSTIADNTSPGTGTAPSANGIGLGTNDNNLTLLNCILSNPGFPELDGTTINATFSCINGGFAGTGNIATAPNFVGGGDYHLQPGSPCRDAGTSTGSPATDLENNPRPQGSGIDMGAFEGTGSGTLVQACTINFTPLDATDLNLKATALPNQKVLLQWQPNPTMENISIEHSVDGNKFVERDQTSPDAQSWTDLAPTIGHNFYRLRGLNPDGTTVFSEVRLALIDQAQRLQLHAFPNPTAGRLHLSLSHSSQPITLQLFRNDGQLVLTQEQASATSLDLDLGKYPAGNYLLRVRHGQEHLAKSIVISY